MSSTTAPAFTAVAARRTLTGSEPSVPKPSPTIWSKEVREWVSRGFAAATDDDGITHDELTAKIKQIITEYMSNESMYSVDWSILPIPQYFIQQERQQAILGPAYQPNAMYYPTPPPPLSTFREQATVPASKKRKSSELGVDQEPPWRKSNSLLEDRVTYANPTFEDRAEKRSKKRRDETNKATSKYQNDLELRKQRFGLHSPSPSQPPWRSRSETPAPDASSGPVIGTNEDLEKKYFRLTSAPKPEAVRPQRVLENSLKFLKKKWREGASYPYICDQFKSMRQDLTVQHLKNEFTVSVYELHARIALEKGDLGEYNQCQTQLRALYAQGLQGHPTEFLAYRILYFIHTANKTDLNDVLAELTPAEKDDVSVKHALDVRSAIALGNYHKLFRLFIDPPNMSGYIMDRFIDRERVSALAKMGRGYKRALSLRFLAEELAFESVQQCHDWFIAVGAQDLLESKEDGSVWLAADTPTYKLFESARQTTFSKVDIKGQI
ncbi:SAC3/GANP family protein [Eremomyces bilateralis CBS 781.70]|uniref:SAC3/GANP family protein n=1 Tax=Eremomyces bilateralis CBS 781.70 TaxID=1392243 RepID=A0A6G1G5R1_9PEZI|nr:SAC3/GANP family protein [Eremomyces bilateralis CBS 781.70]KAF1813276.1 SAC3/GANP family protein [Eremomyces bilateralis CBS 781.70]